MICPNRDLKLYKWIIGQTLLLNCANCSKMLWGDILVRGLWRRGLRKLWSDVGSLTMVYDKINQRIEQPFRPEMVTDFGVLGSDILIVMGRPSALTLQ
mmetsp:Transcript_32734/g.72183  ORF Transcript_32734/g.72183 Transcript_32734/m.72183 type:complete len:98 (-) Transcript_32734:33-326(-)